MLSVVNLRCVAHEKWKKKYAAQFICAMNGDFLKDSWPSVLTFRTASYATPCKWPLNSSPSRCLSLFPPSIFPFCLFLIYYSLSLASVNDCSVHGCAKGSLFFLYAVERVVEWASTSRVTMNRISPDLFSWFHHHPRDHTGDWSFIKTPCRWIQSNWRERWTAVLYQVR